MKKLDKEVYKNSSEYKEEQRLKNARKNARHREIMTEQMKQDLSESSKKRLRGELAPDNPVPYKGPIPSMKETPTSNNDIFQGPKDLGNAPHSSRNKNN